MAEVLSYHKNFTVRRLALQLIGEFLLWGDLEALLIINFTEYLSMIANRVVEAHKKVGRTGVFCFYPEIENQNREK